MQHDAQQPAPNVSLGAALLALVGAEAQFAHHWRTAFLQHSADTDTRLALYRLCREGRRWVLNTSQQATCTLVLNQEAKDLFCTLIAVQNDLRTRGQLPTLLRMQGEAADARRLHMALSMLRQCAVKHLSLCPNISTSDKLSLVLDSFQHLTHLSMDADLTDDLMPVLLQHAAQLKRVSVAKVLLTHPTPPSPHLACNWEQLTIRDSVAKNGVTQPVQLYPLLRMPPSAPHTHLTVTLPPGSWIGFTAHSGQGLPSHFLQRVQRLLFTNLCELRVTPERPAAWLPVSEQADMLHTALQQLHTAIACCNRLHLSGWQLSTAAWQAVAAVVQGSAAAVVIDNTPHATPPHGLTITSPILNLQRLVLTLPLTDPLLTALLDHAPNLTNLTVPELALCVGSAASVAQRACKWQKLTISGQLRTNSGKSTSYCRVRAAALASLPVTQGLTPLQLVLPQQGVILQFEVQSTQGVDPAVLTLLPALPLTDIASVELDLTSATVAAVQQGPVLAAAITQLAPLQSDRRALRLHGWVTAHAVVETVLAMTGWSKVELMERGDVAVCLALRAHAWQLPTSFAIRCPLTDTLLSFLLQHRPDIEELTVAGVELMSDRHSNKTWNVKQLTITVGPEGEEPQCSVDSLVRMPQCRTGKVKVGVQDGDMSLEFSDIHQKGVPARVRGMLQTVEFSSVSDVTLRFLPGADPLADQTHMLTAALRQLFASLTGARPSMHLHGLVMTHCLAFFLRGGCGAAGQQQMWRDLSLTGLRWAPDFTTTPSILPPITDMQLITPLYDETLEELIRSATHIERLSIAGGLRLLKTATQLPSTLGAVEVVDAEVSILHLLRLLHHNAQRVVVKNCAVVFRQDHGVQDQLLSMCVVEEDRFRLDNVEIRLQVAGDQLKSDCQTTEDFRLLAEAFQAMLCRIDQGISKLTLSGWQITPDLLRMLPYEVSGCELCFTDDVRWPEDPQCWLGPGMPRNAVAFFKSWQLPRSCTADCVYHLCTAMGQALARMPAEVRVQVLLCGCDPAERDAIAGRVQSVPGADRIVFT